MKSRPRKRMGAKDILKPIIEDKLDNFIDYKFKKFEQEQVQS